MTGRCFTTSKTQAHFNSMRLFFQFVLILWETSLYIAAQQPPCTMSSIDTELAGICGEESSPYAERVRLIHRLPSNLAPEQLEHCRAFLESPLAGQPLPDLEFNGLKNELVFALLRQREGLTELAELLVRMSRAPETDATWRDYCVQFLGKCYPHIHGEKSRAAIGWGVGVLGVPLARCPLFRASVDVLGIFP